MSFDIVSPPGAYGADVPPASTVIFSRSNWGWRPIARYVKAVAPALAGSVRKEGRAPRYSDGWEYNDGFGLDVPASRALARVLREELASGRADRYVAQRDARIAALPRVPCDLCGATGCRTDHIGFSLGFHKRASTDPLNPRFGKLGWCNACDGWGTKPDSETYYPLEVRDIEDFAAFLEKCEGFEIW